MMNEKKYTFDERTLSDLHKDAHGYRPRSESFWATWNEADDDAKQGIWNGLISDLEQTLTDRNAAEISNLISFEADVARAIDYGATDREDAIRWVLEAAEITADDAAYGGTYVCHHFGLSYNLADQFQPHCDRIVARSNLQ